MKPLKIVVFGASGGCGRWVVRLAAQRGWQVTAFYRPGKSVSPLNENVRAVEGDLFSVADVSDALKGQDVVISCIGLRRTQSRNPWSKLLSPPDLTQKFIAHLIPLLKKRKIKRLLTISAAGVAESFSQLSRPIQFLVSAGKIGVAYKDLAAMEEALRQSKLDWLAVRPVTLAPGFPMGPAREGRHYGNFSAAKRSEVAAYLVEQAGSKKSFSNRTPLLISR